VHHEALSWLVPPSGGRITHLAGVLGRGLGREITRLVVAWGFGDLGLHRIKLEVLAFNISSADIPVPDRTKPRDTPGLAMTTITMVKPAA